MTAESRRTYWLSFVDLAAPEGTRFRGVAIVDVARDEAEQEIVLRPEFSWDTDRAYLAAALRASWRAGVNPGGEVASHRVDEEATPEQLALLPRLRLMQKPELEALEQALAACVNRV